MPPTPGPHRKKLSAIAEGWFVLFALRLRRAFVRIVRCLLFRKFDPHRALRCILVFRTGRLGDFLNAVPALHLVRKRFPGARIVLATTASALPSMNSQTASYADLAALPWLELVTPALVDRAMSFALSGRDHGTGAMRRLLREERPDAVFVLSNMGEALDSKLKKLLFFRLSGFNGPIFGFNGLASRRSMQRQQFKLGLYEHEVYGPVRAVSECPAVGPVREDELIQDIFIPDSAMQWAGSAVEELGFADRLIVAVAPGASFPHKMWPTDRFVAVCRQLLREFDCRFLIVGADADRAWAAQMAEELRPYCADMTGRTSVTQLAALLRHCRLFLGNDGGPAHLASAVGCPCVTVTSALDFPGIWEPWNSRGRVARVRIHCEYCLSMTSCPEKTNACINAVDESAVLHLGKDVLAGEAIRREELAQAAGSMTAR